MVTNTVTVEMLQQAIEMLQQAIANSEKKRYRVGDVLMRFNDVSPARDYGGTWEKTAQGRFPIGVGGGYSLNATGGEAAHTLTVGEMPKHNHALIEVAGGSVAQEYGSDAMSAGEYHGNFPVYTDGTYFTGGSQSHNNMPPYIAFNFWKKIAN